MKKIPFVEAEGNNYDIGFEIGKKLRKQIKNIIYLNNKFYLRTTGKDFNYFAHKSKPYLKFAEKFPQYISELEGIASGSNMEFKEIFSLVCQEEMVFARGKCSAIAAKTSDGRMLLGHNEEWAPHYADGLYIIRATQENKPDFLSVAYIGNLPGTSAGLNDCGIGFSSNSIDVANTRTGVPKSFISRSVLDSRNIKEAVKFLTVKPRALGKDCLIVHRNGFIVDLEESTDRHAIIKSRKWLVHTNHLLKLKGVKEIPEECSFWRLERARELFMENEKKINFELFKKILIDHHNFPDGICCHLCKCEGDIKYSTIASAIIDVTRGALHVAAGKPCQSSYVKYKMFA